MILSFVTDSYLPIMTIIIMMENEQDYPYCDHLDF